MPFVTPEIDAQLARRKRILISGQTGMRKTTAALTFPPPVHLLSYPGEKGYDVIPLDNPAIKPYIWQGDPIEIVTAEDGTETIKVKLPSVKVIQEVKKLTWNILGGKYGPVTTFFGDGLHKLYPYFLDKACNGAFFAGQEFEARAYGIAHIEFMDYLTTICHSNVEVVGFSIWDADEKDRPQKPGEKSDTYKFVDVHKYPDLPGRLAKRILGEFSVVVGAVLRSPKPGAPLEAMWQLRPSGEIWGCGVKINPDLALKLPEMIPANYNILANLLKGEWNGGTTQSSPPPSTLQAKLQAAKEKQK